MAIKKTISGDKGRGDRTRELEQQGAQHFRCVGNVLCYQRRAGRADGAGRRI